MAIIGYCLGSLGQRHAKLSHHIIYNKDKGSKHTCSLKRVGPHQRLYAATSSVEPYQRNHAHYSQRERHTHSVEHKPLQYNTNNIKAHCSSRHLRHKKEPGSRLVRAFAKPLFKISVNGCEVEPIVHRQQHESNGEIAQDETYARLYIGHVGAHCHSWHTYKRDARDRSSHHAKRHHIPRRTAVSTKESLVVSSTTGGEMAEKH